MNHFNNGTVPEYPPVKSGRIWSTIQEKSSDSESTNTRIWNSLWLCWTLFSVLGVGGRGWGSSINATVQPPTLHEVGGGADYASTDLIEPVGSGGLPIMHCAPKILSKIGIDVRNPRLCDPLQGRIKDFATWGGGGGGGARCMLDHLRCALGSTPLPGTPLPDETLVGDWQTSEAARCFN